MPNSILFRYPTATIYKNEEKERFTTTWRPKTTFGFKNDFDLERYLRTNKERKLLLSNTAKQLDDTYSYESHPHVLIK